MAGNLVERVAEVLHRYNMVDAGARLGVAVSGGADSVVLLHILRQLANRFSAELVVLHVNHRLRGASSDADESFVRSLAASMNLPCLVSHPPLGQGNLEAAARRLRREFFAACRQSHNLTRIALGHTRSDQAETVLHRFLRGTGLRGLAGMRFVTTDGFIRPLLTTSREEVRDWATAEGLAWREDSSNEDVRFTRNRLRRETIPLLTKAYNENLEAILAGTAALAQAEEDYWEEQVSRAYALFAKRTRLGLIFQTGDLNSLPLALRRRLIRRALDELRTSGLAGLDFSHIEGILALCESTEGHDRVLVPGADALRSFDSLLLSPAGRLTAEPRGYSISLKIGEQKELPFGAGTICLHPFKPDVTFCDKFKEDQDFSIQRVRLSGAIASRGSLFVRNWEPGDEVHRPGHNSAEKIKRLFQENRVPLWDRRHWPVVLCGNEIAWVRDFGVAEKFASSGQEAHGVELTYKAGEPDRQKGVP